MAGVTMSEEGLLEVFRALMHLVIVLVGVVVGKNLTLRARPNKPPKEESEDQENGG